MTGFRRKSQKEANCPKDTFQLKLTITERESDNSWPRNVKPCKSTLTEETHILVQLYNYCHVHVHIRSAPRGLPGCTIEEVIVTVILSGVVQCSGLLADFAQACLNVD